MLGGVCLAVLAAPALAAEVTQQRLENADGEPQNWITTFQNYSSHRYSRLDEITPANVANLRAAFSLPLTSGMDGITAASNMEAAPLVEDGQMYIQSVSGIFWQIDVTRGNRGIVTWKVDPTVDLAAENWTVNRGVALWGNAVYGNLVDGRVVAVDRATGEFLWDKQVARTTLGYENLAGGPGPEHFVSGEKFTAAPLAVEGKILVGQSGGDWATRGWLAAINAADGSEIWRSYTIPGPGEPGHETWQDDHNAWRTGGGSLWTTGSYDAGQRVTIWGTANPVPMYDAAYRPGDNLWTNSALAFDIDSGAIKWGFQYVPNEAWDFDEQGVHMLYDTTINGEPRKVVGHFGRNGFFYQIDRGTGQFIGAIQYTHDLTWTAGLDPKTGMPVEYNPDVALQTYIPDTHPDRGKPRIMACPRVGGGVRWQPTAYNPETHIMYAAGAEGCQARGVGPKDPVGPLGGNPMGPGLAFAAGGGEGDPPGAKQAGAITAINVETTAIVAKQDLPYENQSGVLLTSGGLLFTGNADGGVAAYNAQTLEQLWVFYTGATYKAPPIAYAVNGKEYIAIIAAGGPVTANPDRGAMDRDAQLWVFTL